MNELYTVNYKDEGPFFLSNFGQITRCVRIHGVHNEEAIDRNTEAIIEQTEMQHAESDESQVQFSGHSMMLERESNETQNIMTAHTKMQKDESDETQEILRNGHNSIKNAITAHTNAMQQEGVSNRQVLNNQLQGISAKLQGIADKIDSNAARTISDAISRLDLVVNNYINP
jgi:hypothetical protein